MSGGHCGSYVTCFRPPRQEIYEIINALHREGRIEIRPGIHGELIFYKADDAQVDNSDRGTMPEDSGDEDFFWARDKGR